MGRTVRRAFNAVTSALFLLCLVLTVSLWSRSYRFGDWTIFRTSGSFGGSIISEKGELQLRVLAYSAPLNRTDCGQGSYPILPPQKSGGGLFGGTGIHEPPFDEQEENQLLGQ